MNFWRTLMRSSKKLVGTDQFGNKYYEILQSGTNKPKRLIESKLKHEEYREGMIPMEWESWIRHKRKDPPTIEEIIKRERLTVVVKQRGIEVDLRDKELQEREYEEGLVAEPVRTQAQGHASAPKFHTIQSSEDAVSDGKEFEPAAWVPPKRKK